MTAGNKCRKILGKSHRFLLKLPQMHPKNENLRECCKMPEREGITHYKEPHNTAWAQHIKHTGVAQKAPKTRGNSHFLLEMQRWIPQRRPEKLARLHSAWYNVAIYQSASFPNVHRLTKTFLSGTISQITVPGPINLFDHPEKPG